MIIFALPDAVKIMFTILILLVICGLCVLLCFSIIKTMRYEKNNIVDKQDSGFVSKNTVVKCMDEFIHRFRFDNEMSLILFELDDFKSIKDSFGIKQYERFSKTLQNRITNNLPKNILICEMGVDQYAVLIRGKIPMAKLESFAESILRSIEAPLTLPDSTDGKISLTASMGIVVYPAGGSFSSDLLKNAEMALYMDKKDSSKRFVVFSNDIDKSESENMEYYREIKDAIRNKEFTLVYQPIIDTKNNDIFGMEALIRWNHPNLGVLSPNKFLNIMEHTGDIIWVGKWGIEVVCKQLVEWRKKYPEKKFFISFNLSPKQLIDPQIAIDFQTIIKRYHVNPKDICLEIVEFAMFEKYSIIGDNITKLHNIGFLIAIDDFGLDVNSLSRISSLSIDIIKFEKRFVETAKDNFMMTKVLEMLVDYSNEQNKTIVAEGVEDLTMLAQVNEFNIYCAQGWLYSKPISPFEMEKYIEIEQWKVAVIPVEPKTVEEKEVKVVADALDPSLIKETVKEESDEQVVLNTDSIEQQTSMVEDESVVETSLPEEEKKD